MQQRVFISRRSAPIVTATVRMQSPRPGGGSRIVKRVRYLIRPSRRSFKFASIHDIDWADVADSPSFDELWPSLSQEPECVVFFATHSASFDRSVLTACYDSARIQPPPHH
jgi:DNA polymerase-3 subunit epsilon